MRLPLVRRASPLRCASAGSAVRAHLALSEAGWMRLPLVGRASPLRCASARPGCAGPPGLSGDRQDELAPGPTGLAAAVRVRCPREREKLVDRDGELPAVD